MFDIAVIGGGPAAFSAAITARQRNKSTLVCRSFSAGGWLRKAERVDNYPGLTGMRGAEILELFERQSVGAGARIQEGTVRQILKTEKGFMLLVQNDVAEAKAVIIATGAAQPKILENEDALLGKGVSYCATCDGMFYKGKRVAVLAYSVHALPEARFLASLAEEVIYITPDPKLAEGLDDGITVLLENPVKILGQNRAEGVLTDRSEIRAGGVFVFRDATAYDILIPDVRVENRFIQVGRHMETNVAGLYAAGDCTGRPFQVAKAVGEGNVAAVAASDYLDVMI
jgi:thioredoxin reductase (NADPH)